MTKTLDTEGHVTKPSRGSWRAGAAAAIILVVSSILIQLIGSATVLGGLVSADVGEYLGSLATQIGADLVRGILFGAGVVVALRFLASIPLQAGWRRMVSRILLATGGGGALVFIALVLVALVAAVSPGQYPFGYNFQPTFDGYSIGYGILSALVSGLVAFVTGVPVVGLVLLWQQLFLSSVA